MESKPNVNIFAAEHSERRRWERRTGKQFSCYGIRVLASASFTNENLHHTDTACAFSPLDVLVPETSQLGRFVQDHHAKLPSLPSPIIAAVEIVRSVCVC